MYIRQFVLSGKRNSLLLEYKIYVARKGGEGRRQKLEDGRRKTEDRRPKTEVKRQKLKVKKLKLNNQ